MMRWAVVVCLIVGAGAGAGASLQQGKESPADAFELGRAAHNAGRTDEAVSAFERAVALDSTSSLYHVWLGHAYSRQLSSASFLRKPYGRYDVRTEPIDNLLSCDGIASSLAITRSDVYEPFSILDSDYPVVLGSHRHPRGR